MLFILRAGGREGDGGRGGGGDRLVTPLHPFTPSPTLPLWLFSFVPLLLNNKLFHEPRKSPEYLVNASHTIYRLVDASLTAVINDRLGLLPVNINPVFNYGRILVIGSA